MQLCCTLRVDSKRSPCTVEWVSRHGVLSSAVLSQLAETGLRGGARADNAQSTCPVFVPRIDEATGAQSVLRLRLRAALHPLSHPFLIDHLVDTPAELHRRTLINAIEIGIQIVLGVRQDVVSTPQQSVQRIQKAQQGDSASVVPVQAPQSRPGTLTAAAPVPDVAIAAAPSPEAVQPVLLDLNSISTLFPASDGE